MIEENLNTDTCFVSLAAISIDENAPKRGIGGIYQIRNTINGKRYIGSAISFRQRWSVHLAVLRNRTSHSRYLQSAWNKYGEDAFAFEVVEIVATKDEILQREQMYLDTLEPEYNMVKDVQGRRGSCSEKTKEKLRRPKSPETRRRMSEGAKRSYQLNPELRQARIDNFNAVRAANPNHNRGMNNGMFGKSVRTGTFDSPEVKARRAASLKRAFDEGRAKRFVKPIEQLTPDGDLVQHWPSLIEAAKAVGCSQSAISNNCRGRQVLTAGFQWRYPA